MLSQITGLHHVTALAADARKNNAFFTETLGLRRVKKTVNFDAPDVYHLYYGTEAGAPGTVMTYFPFPAAARGTPGTGEVSETAFAVPEGALGYWKERLAARGVTDIATETLFGADRLVFDGPDGERLALVEAQDARAPWTGGGVPADVAIRGFYGARLALRDADATTELLQMMGYTETDSDADLFRYVKPGGNGAEVIDLHTLPGTPPGRQGAGSVHHIAFSVPDRASQLEVRRALSAAGHTVTPVIDRDYFWAIYFRTPGGVLFEIATDEPGFDRDEDAAHLGEALKLPSQHEHLRPQIEAHLEPIAD